jgi:signal peptidase I
VSEAIPMRKIRYLGSSMSPTLRSLEILWVRPYTDGIPRCGDVVVFSSSTGTQLVAHRIVSRAPGGFRVQGDNNPKVDSDLVSPGKIVGQVVYSQGGAENAASTAEGSARVERWPGESPWE